MYQKRMITVIQEDQYEKDKMKHNNDLLNVEKPPEVLLKTVNYE